MIVRLTLMIVLVLQAPSLVHANNNWFLPGDAYYPTELTGEEVEKLKTSQRRPAVFKYSALGGYSGAFCGYAGYGVAQVEQLDEPFIKNLKSAYKRVVENEASRGSHRRIGRRKERSPTLRMLIYPKAHEGPKIILGLRYNENWKAETVKFGHHANRVRECHLLKSKPARAISKSQAAEVPALRARLPEAEQTPYGVRKEPILIQGPVRAFVIGRSTLDEQLNPKQFQTYRLVVDSTGVWEQWFEDEGWVTQGINN